MSGTANLPARNRTVADIIEEYDEKVANANSAIQGVNDAWRALEMASSVAGKYGGSISRHPPHVGEHDVLSSLLKSGWRAIYDRCQIDMIASADDKRLFERTFENPPFYGRHYVKHVRHALKFLKPGGTLVSILPATAWYDHKELSGRWEDLPVASFADAGTNVPTGILTMRIAA